MKLGKRLPRLDEREEAALGSLMPNTMGGDTKLGMRVVETRRVPLVASCTCADLAGWDPEFWWNAPAGVTSVELEPPAIGDVQLAVVAVVDEIVSDFSGFSVLHEFTDSDPSNFDTYVYLLSRPASADPIEFGLSGTAPVVAGMVGGFPTGHWGLVGGPVNLGTTSTSLASNGHGVFGVLLSAQNDDYEGGNLELTSVPSGSGLVSDGHFVTSGFYRLDFEMFSVEVSADPFTVNHTAGDANQYRWGFAVGCTC